MKFTKKLFFSVFLGANFVFSSCSQNSDFYYIALRRQAEGNTAEAKRLFSKAIKTGSSYEVRLSMEELVQLGNVRERVEACDVLVDRFKDDDSMLLAAKQYSQAGEYSKIVLLTNNLDYEKCANKLAYLRLDAMRRKNDSRFFNEMYSWFTVRKISSEHYKLYCEVAKESPLSELQKILPVLEFRTNVYKRNYKEAFENYTVSKQSLPMIPQIVSDIGKVCLYGSDTFYKNALAFDSLAKQLKDRDSEFYALFYAGRLYEKAGNYFTYAINRYKSSMECAAQDAQFDNALWYLLNIELKRSTAHGINCVKKYCSKWHDPEYFEDFFDTLVPIMLSEGLWDDFYSLYKAIDGYATDAVTAKFAYIYGRLVQEKMAMPLVTDTHGSEDDAAFTRALTSGSEKYYRIMAISRLGIAGTHCEEVICNPKYDSVHESDSEAEKILLNYATFGLPEKIYPMWQRFLNENRKIGYEVGLKIAGFLRDCGENKNSFYPQSLRIAAKVIGESDRPVSKEDLKLLYPRAYSEILPAKCEKYKIPEEIFYALVRSESFFDSTIKSSAGAIGLSQLMRPTAEDIAHRLKYESYDLNNPEHNLEFGAWYIAHLYGRLENKWLPAFFAYNAGITSVRRWQKSARIEFDNIHKLPLDLFLETIPYSETRQYGRKLISAATMYAWLYNGTEIFEEVNLLEK